MFIIRADHQIGKYGRVEAMWTAKVLDSVIFSYILTKNWTIATLIPLITI